MVSKFIFYPYIENQLFEQTEKCYATNADIIVGLQEVGEDFIKRAEKRCVE
jgi:hypothetical protein